MLTGTYLRVTAGGEHYALSIENVLEVVEMGDVTPVPGAPLSVAGVRNLRGQLIPVFHLAAALGLPTAVAPPLSIAIADQDGARVGLAIDRVLDVDALPAADQGPAVRGLAGAVLMDGALVGVVDVPAVLATLESQVAAA